MKVGQFSYFQADSSGAVVGRTGGSGSFGCSVPGGMRWLHRASSAALAGLVLLSRPVITTWLQRRAELGEEGGARLFTRLTCCRSSKRGCDRAGGEEPRAAVTAGRGISNPTRTKGKRKGLEEKKLLVSKAVSG